MIVVIVMYAVIPGRFDGTIIVKSIERYHFLRNQQISTHMLVDILKNCRTKLIEKGYDKLRLMLPDEDILPVLAGLLLNA